MAKSTRKPTRSVRKPAKSAKKAKAPAAPRLPAVSPYLAVGDAAGAIAWYKEVFGAKAVGETMLGPGGKVLHAMLDIGGSYVMLSDIFPQADLVDPTRAGASVNLHYFRPNAGHVWERAVAKGAKVTMPFTDQFWGDRYGRIIDPYGHSWSIARKSPLSKKELEALRAKAMAGMLG